MKREKLLGNNIIKYRQRLLQSVLSLALILTVVFGMSACTLARADSGDFNNDELCGVWLVVEKEQDDVSPLDPEGFRADDAVLLLATGSSVTEDSPETQGDITVVSQDIKVTDNGGVDTTITGSVCAEFTDNDKVHLLLVPLHRKNGEMYAPDGLGMARIVASDGIGLSMSENATDVEGKIGKLGFVVKYENSLPTERVKILFMDDNNKTIETRDVDTQDTEPADSVRTIDAPTGAAFAIVEETQKAKNGKASIKRTAYSRDDSLDVDGNDIDPEGDGIEHKYYVKGSALLKRMSFNIRF